MTVVVTMFYKDANCGYLNEGLYTRYPIVARALGLAECAREQMYLAYKMKEWARRISGTFLESLNNYLTEIWLPIWTWPEFWFRWNLGRYWFRSGTRRFGRYRDFFVLRVSKVAKRNVENKYCLKSKYVEMLLIMNYNLRFRNFRYWLLNHI